MSLETGVTALAQAVGADVKTINTKLNKTSAAGFDNYLANATATGSLALSLATVLYHDLTVTGNLTLTFTNVPVPSGQIFYFVTKITMGGTLRTIAYPTATWLTATGAAPTIAVGKTAELIWSTTNGTTFTVRVGATT